MKALKLNPTLTLADAKRQVKAMGLTLVRKADTDEYVVKSPDGGTYHTDDLADAVNTARDLSGRPAVMGGKSSHRNPPKRTYSWMALAPDRSPLAGYEMQASGIQSVKRSRKTIADGLRRLYPDEDFILTRPVRKPFDSKKLRRNPHGQDLEYVINLDERGEFFADVRRNGETIFEIHGTEIFEDGFMRHKHDVAGLEEYLRDLKVIGSNESIASSSQSPRFAGGKAPHRNPPKPGTYAGGVGFWRKSIGLAEGTPKHLGPRPQHTTDVDYVEYVRPLAGEPVFELGGNRYQYVVGRYPSGREDIAVYSFAGDVTHGYAFFRRMLNLT